MWSDMNNLINLYILKNIKISEKKKKIRDYMKISEKI